MAPRRTTFGIYGSDSKNNEKAIYETQTEITALYGYPGSHKSIFSKTELHGQIAVYFIYAIFLFAGTSNYELFVKKRERPPGKMFTPFRFRWKWVLLLGLSLFFTVSVALQGTSFICLSLNDDVGLSFRFTEDVAELLWGVGEIMLWPVLFMVAKMTTNELRDSTVGTLGTKTAKVLSLGFWSVWTALSGIIIGQVGIGLALASDSYKQYNKGGDWRLGDRGFAMVLSFQQIQKFIFHEPDHDTLEERNVALNAMRERFISVNSDDAWISLRQSQIYLEVVRNVLGLVLVLGFAYAAIRKFNARRTFKQFDDVAPYVSLFQPVLFFSSNTRLTLLQIIRRFLYFVLPSILLSTLFNLIVLLIFTLPNYRITTSLDAWDDWSKSASDPITRESSYTSWTSSRQTEVYSFDGYWLDGYKFAMNSFPIVIACIKPWGFMVAVMAISALGAKIVEDPKKKEKKDMEKQMRVNMGLEDGVPTQPAESNVTQLNK